jgi:hypothetical protein
MPPGFGEGEFGVGPFGGGLTEPQTGNDTSAPVYIVELWLESGLRVYSTRDLFLPLQG